MKEQIAQLKETAKNLMMTAQISKYIQVCQEISNLERTTRVEAIRA